jgi:hypothetical protein
VLITCVNYRVRNKHIISKTSLFNASAAYKNGYLSGSEVRDLKNKENSKLTFSMWEFGKSVSFNIYK